MDTIHTDPKEAIYKITSVKVTDKVGATIATPVVLPATVMCELSGKTAKPPVFPETVYDPSTTYNSGSIRAEESLHWSGVVKSYRIVVEVISSSNVNAGGCS